MPMKKTLITLLILIVTLVRGAAQSGDQDFARSIGKIYVVVAVIIAIFIGIVIFLIYLDRRLAKLENQIKGHD